MREHIGNSTDVFLHGGEADGGGVDDGNGVRTVGATTAWSEVVAELRASCIKRAAPGALWRVPGAVAVLYGAAPVMWIYGPTDPDAVAAVLAGASDVHEVYVDVDLADAVESLTRSAWQRDIVALHLVHDGMTFPEPGPDLPVVVPLHPGDLADMRDLLLRQAGVPNDQVVNSYGDDFFTVAAPVVAFGARDSLGRLVGVSAVRQQGRSAMGFGLTVDRAWRSTGLSTALVSAAVRHAVDSGAAFVHVQGCAASRRCLLECGFQVAGSWQRLVRAV